jgi:AraC family transcriptional regulator of adaptative response/methylated-DNA-[protein]-cysteine methyltransferase
MPTLQLNPASSKDESRWQAVVRRDRSADGTFVYAVETTGIFCRPSCAARRALRENVQFFPTTSAAKKAGFRPCKRCRPDEDSSVDSHAAAVSRACRLIEESQSSVDLPSLAAAAGLSPSHFHRVFKSMTGVTPRDYAAAHRSQRVRDRLTSASSSSSSISWALYNAGYNSSGRFYSTAAKTLGMKPADFKAGGKGATIRFAAGECSLGAILVAATELGVCAIFLGDDPVTLLHDLEDRFPQANIVGGDRDFEKLVAQVVAFVERPAAGLNLPLHVQGTAFQHRVWKALCEIPPGQTRNYAQIARRSGNPNATRAAAKACCANPLAVAIPCHRVIRTDGGLAGYRWGIDRKAKLLQTESRR